MAKQGDPEARAALSTRDLFNLFLDAIGLAVDRGEMEPITYEGYVRFLGGADDAFGQVPAADLRPLHVQKWVDGEHPHRRMTKGGGAETIMRRWGPTTRNNAIGAVKRAFAWGREQGYLDANPIKEMRKPTPRKRETIPDPEGVAKLFGAVRGPLAELLGAIKATGCRPGEVMTLTAAGVDLDAGTWTVRNKTRHKTGQPTRTVHLTRAMVEVSRGLVERHPEGSLFRNSRGNAWNRHAIAWALNRLRSRLGLGEEVVSYALRHLFATDLRQAGVPDATIAVLMGHSDTKMVERVYGAHLKDRAEHLKEAVEKIDPGAGQGENSGGATEG
jgi:integrase